LDERFINRGNPRNFAGNVNMGLRVIHGEMDLNAIIVNQDTILPSHVALKNLRGKGIVSAQQVIIKENLEIGVLKSTQVDDIINELEKLNSFPVTLTSHQKVTGFCYFISKECMDKIGYLQEYLIASFDDDDNCARARLAGFDVEMSSVKVQHFVSKGFGQCGAYSGHILMVRENQFTILWGIPANQYKHPQYANFIEDNYVWDDSMKVK
jgi:GT2 family glycosyltransferase